MDHIEFHTTKEEILKRSQKTLPDHQVLVESILLLAEVQFEQMGWFKKIFSELEYFNSKK